MNCPKCNHKQKEENIECEKCGIIFTKYYSWLNSNSKSIDDGKMLSSLKDTDSSFSLIDLILYTRPDENILILYGRLVLLIGIIFWGVRFITAPVESNYAGESYMHLINLPFHEAGHVFFRPFGSFMASLGGTIGQLLMPLICFFVLLIKTRDTFGASVTLWWFGQNFFDMAPYINDARSLSLPLVGGNFGYSSPYGFHDWEYLLTESGLLRYDHGMAKLSMITGLIIFITSFAWCGILLYKQYKDRIQYDADPDENTKS